VFLSFVINDGSYSLWPLLQDLNCPELAGGVEDFHKIVGLRCMMEASEYLLCVSVFLGLYVYTRFLCVICFMYIL